MIKGILNNHNLYIIRCYGRDGSMIKLGYTSNMKVRWKSYRLSNPLTEVIDTFYRPDAKQFERWFHMSHDSINMNEWYDESMLNVILEAIDSEVAECYTGKHTFYHEDGSNHINVTRDFMSKKYNLKLCQLGSLVKNKALTVKGWAMSKEVHEVIRERDIHTYYHYNGLVEKNVSKHYMASKYKLNVSGFNHLTKSKKVRVNNGWSFDSNIINDHSSTYSNYTFVKGDIIEKEVTVKYMTDKYQELNSSIQYLNNLCKNKRKQFKGWTIK